MNNHNHITDEELIRLHWAESLTITEIGERLNCSRAIVTSLFDKRGLRRRDKSEAVSLRMKLHPETIAHQKREYHPQWKGGKSKRSDGYVILNMPNHPLARSMNIAWHGTSRTIILSLTVAIFTILMESEAITAPRTLSQFPPNNIRSGHSSRHCSRE